MPFASQSIMIFRASHSPVNGSRFSSIHGTFRPSGSVRTCCAAYCFTSAAKSSAVTGSADASAPCSVS